MKFSEYMLNEGCLTSVNESATIDNINDLDDSKVVSKLPGLSHLKPKASEIEDLKDVFSAYGKPIQDRSLTGALLILRSGQSAKELKKMIKYI